VKKIPLTQRKVALVNKFKTREEVIKKKKANINTKTSSTNKRPN